jgi:FkbM family methyltransferase
MLFVKNIIQPNMVVVDVGAHIGIYSLLLAKLVGEKGKVYSFEPTPKTFDFLNLNIEINSYQDRIIAKSLAITDLKSTMSLSITKQSGLNSLFSYSSEDLKVEVSTVSLDEELQKLLKIDFLKIDAEGAEPLIWKGMKTIIKTHLDLKIIMEFAPYHLIRGGFSPENFYQEIIEDGFMVQKIDDFTGQLMTISLNEILSSFSVNLFLSRT